MAYIQKFMALDPDSGNCVSVARPQTGSVIADFDGNWKGSLGYKNKNGVYNIDLYQFSSVKDETDTTTAVGGQYSQMMDAIKASLQGLATNASTFDLIQNLLIWSRWHMIYTNVGPDGVPYDQAIYLSGQASYMFELDNYQSTISSINSDCDFNLSSTFFNRAERR